MSMSGSRRHSAAVLAYAGCALQCSALTQPPGIGQFDTPTVPTTCWSNLAYIVHVSQLCAVDKPCCIKY